MEQTDWCDNILTFIFRPVFLSVQILFFAMATEYISYDNWKGLMIGKYISENGISNFDFLSA